MYGVGRLDTLLMLCGSFRGRGRGRGGFRFCRFRGVVMRIVVGRDK